MSRCTSSGTPRDTRSSPLWSPAPRPRYLVTNWNLNYEETRTFTWAASYSGQLCCIITVSRHQVIKYLLLNVTFTRMHELLMMDHPQSVRSICSHEWPILGGPVKYQTQYSASRIGKSSTHKLWFLSSGEGLLCVKSGWTQRYSAASFTGITKVSCKILAKVFFPGVIIE